MHNEIIEKLANFSDSIEWERLFCDILSRIGYRGIEPQSVGGKDGGKDAIIWNDSLGKIAAHMSLRKDWKTKLYEDLEKTREKQYDKIIFCSSQLIQGITKDKLKEEVKTNFNVDFDIFDQERFRVEIENNRPDLLRKLGLNTLQIYIENADLLSVPIQEKSKKLKILQKHINENLGSADKVEIQNVNGVPQISINEFLKLITINTTLKIKKERLEGHKDIAEYIYDKTSEGEDVVFSEEEIENLDLKYHGEEIPEGKPKTLKISAQPIDKEIYIDIEIPGSDITYEGIKIAPISRKDDYAVVKSFESEFVLIFKMYRPKEGNMSNMDLKFSLDDNCNNLYQGIKFNKFIRDLKRKEYLIIKDSTTKKIILKGKPSEDSEFDEDWLKLLTDLYKIGQTLNIVFSLPKSITQDEITIIAQTIYAINFKKLKFNFDKFELNFEKENIVPLLEDYEKNGYLNGVTLTMGSLNAKLFGKEINLGEGIAELPPLKINEEIEIIKDKLSNQDKINLELIPYRESFYDVILTDLEDIS
jgi:hypothetical protein